MAQTVERLLHERRSQPMRGRTVGALIALLLHGGAVAFAIAAPSLFAKEKEPLHFVPVTLVPPKLLGAETPPAPKPKPKPKEEKPPDPKPAPVEPSPEAIALPTEDKPKPKPEPEPVQPVQPDPEPPTTEPPPTTAPVRPQGSPTGSPVGVANTDSVVGIEDPNFTYGYYVDRMVAIIRSHWSRPPLGSGVEGIVHFRIAKDGTVQDVRVVNSSGYNSFDLAALRAVQTAPLPPLPKSYKESSLGVNLIFR